MAEGLIIKTSGSLYTVYDRGNRLQCRPRGRLRHEGVIPLAGDWVRYSLSGENQGELEEILPRRNSLVRPPVANVGTLMIVASAAPPVSSPMLIDCMTALAAYKGIRPVIVVNKTDCVPGDELIDLYRSLGYPTVAVSATTGEGLEELRILLGTELCVLSGNSGVGKSSLVNALFPGVSVRTGELSQRIGRGRQTTRHVELQPTQQGGWLADTPGYSSFDALEMEMTDKDRICHCFPEFEPYLGNCRYTDCSHVKDEGCAVLEALRTGTIVQSRHDSFVMLWERVKALKAWEQKPGKTDLRTPIMR